MTQAPTLTQGGLKALDHDSVLSLSQEFDKVDGNVELTGITPHKIGTKPSEFKTPSGGIAANMNILKPPNGFKTPGGNRFATPTGSLKTPGVDNFATPAGSFKPGPIPASVYKARMISTHSAMVTDV